MNLDQLRQFALSLPESMEEPHFHFTSFRVRGKIFATVPPEGDSLHVFVDDDCRERFLALYPHAGEKLWWGKKVAGLKVKLGLARKYDAVLKDLVRNAWTRKAPAALRKAVAKREE